MARSISYWAVKKEDHCPKVRKTGCGSLTKGKKRERTCCLDRGKKNFQPVKPWHMGEGGWIKATYKLEERKKRCPGGRKVKKTSFQMGCRKNQHLRNLWLIVAGGGKEGEKKRRSFPLDCMKKK